MKAVVFIETNFTGVDAIRKSAHAGIKCYLVTSDYEFMKSMLPHDMFDGFENLVEIIKVQKSDDVEEVLAAIQSLKVPVGAVLSFSQFRVLCAAKVAARLGLKGTSPAALATALDKSAVRQAMKISGAPSIKFLSLSSVLEVETVQKEVGLPCILKPSRGHSSLEIQLIRNKQELFTGVLRALSGNAPGEILVEEFLEGPLFSLETVTVAPGQHVVWGYTDRELSSDFIELGATFPATPPDFDAGVKLVCSALDAIGFDFGACHTEMIFTKNGPRIVEINPRAAGSGVCRLVERATGRDVVLDFVKMHIEDPMTDSLTSVKAVTMRSILPSDSGRIVSLPSREQILSLQGVKDVWFQRKIGEQTNDTRSNFSWILTVLAESENGATSVENADAAAEWAAARVRIEVSTPRLVAYGS